MATVRVFVADAVGASSELTTGSAAPVRVSAPDLREAHRLRSRIRAAAVVRGDDPDRLAVIVDLAVAVADDFRSARKALASADTASSLCYAGTVSGLAGLIADIFVAGVADGVTLIPIGPGVDPRPWADDVLARLSHRLPVAVQPRAS